MMMPGRNSFKGTSMGGEALDFDYDYKTECDCVIS